MRHGLATANADICAAEMIGEEVVDLVGAGHAILHPHDYAPAGGMVVAAPGVVGRGRRFGGRLQGTGLAWPGGRPELFICSPLCGL